MEKDPNSSKIDGKWGSNKKTLIFFFYRIFKLGRYCASNKENRTWENGIEID